MGECGAAGSRVQRSLYPRIRDGYALDAVVASWAVCVFLVVSTSGRRAFASVPGTSLASFYERLDHGDLDEVVGTYLAQPAAGRMLMEWGQTGRAALYDGLGSRQGLLFPELLPQGVRPA